MTNLDVIYAFLHRKPCSTTNLYSTGDKLINYNTCIAQYYIGGLIILNATQYSRSTSRIQNYLYNSIVRSNIRYRNVYNVSKDTRSLL